MRKLILKSGISRYIKEKEEETCSEVDLRAWLKRELRRGGITYLDPCCYTKYTYNTCCQFSPIVVKVDSINGIYTFNTCHPEIEAISNPYGNIDVFSSTAQEMQYILSANTYGGQTAIWGTNNCEVTLTLPVNDPVPLNMQGQEYNIFKYNTYVAFVDILKVNYPDYSDLVDLTPFDSPERNVSTGALHSLKWYEISNVNVFNNVNWFTDTFRQEFQDVSIGNRGELDYVGITSQNAQSWAKNYCDFVNTKMKDFDICGVQYFDPDSESLQSVDGYYYYSYDFYVILPLNKTLKQITYATYTAQENIVATNWNGVPFANIPAHSPIITLDSVKEFNLQPEYFGGPIVDTPDCIIKVGFPQ